uniref:ATP-dependent RNA helicase n=1 Tax=Steinernema glaseri TaxID=37863 RepID=A0A1I7Z8I9_9BILA
MKEVEYVMAIFERAKLPCTYIYSQLDPTARKMNIALFRDKKVNLLVVTDVAARGVDIPLLDNAINYNFPPKAKLFVHRVARKMNIALFRDKKVNLLVVTDVAARGVDIPLLDNAINYNFPPKAKLFVHRVGMFC